MTMTPYRIKSHSRSERSSRGDAGDGAARADPDWDVMRAARYNKRRQRGHAQGLACNRRLEAHLAALTQVGVRLSAVLAYPQMR